jgi:3-phenylpropionate/trans-cinnamate dioxygenase ferredoxin component
MYNYVQLPTEQCDFLDVASLNDLPPGERLYLEVDGQAIVLFNIAGHIYAISDVCTHDYGPLGDGELDQYEIICPRHGARFDVRTGKVTALPAVEDIAAYPVRIVNDQIEIGLPKN